MKKRLVVLISLLFIPIYSSTQQYQKAYCVSLPKTCRLERSPEEGFCAGTLVKIPGGYVPIQKIGIGDVVIDAHGNETGVVAIQKTCANRCIKICLHDSVIFLGYDQRLHLDKDCSWVKAGEVPEAESVAGFVVLYALTTQSHTLCVTVDDIVAHNAAALLGPLVVNFGYVSIANPVTVVLGATVALAVVAYNAQQKYAQKYADRELPSLIPDTVVCADHFYYLSRKRDLEKVRNELLQVKGDLEKIHGLSSGCFTQQFLQQHTYDVMSGIWSPSLEQEKRLSAEQKLQLQKVREDHLASIEKQIEDIQLLLALHVNQVIANFYESELLDSRIEADINNAIDAWNSNLYDVTDAIAWQALKCNLVQEDWISGIRQSLDELAVVMAYYQNCKNVCIRESTSIISVLESLEDRVNEKRQRIENAEQVIRSNAIMLEHYFARRNIAIVSFKSEVKEEFSQQRKKRELQVLKSVEDSLSGSGFPGGPKKDDEDEYPFGRYEDASYHHKNSKGEKSVCPEDGQDVLNNSIASPNQNSKRRYGVSRSGQFVVLDETSPRLYHGHVVEWKELGKVKGLQRELVAKGMASRSGKAIYKMANKLIKR